jgi:hypothetical protein
MMHCFDNGSRGSGIMVSMGDDEDDDGINLI